MPKRRIRKATIPEHNHLTHHRGEDTKLWLCSLEDTAVPDLSQLSPINLQKDYYQLCSQQPWECRPMLLHTRLACPLEL